MHTFRLGRDRARPEAEKRVRRRLEWPRQAIMRDSTRPVVVGRDSRNNDEAKSAGLGN